MSIYSYIIYVIFFFNLNAYHHDPFIRYLQLGTRLLAKCAGDNDMTQEAGSFLRVHTVVCVCV